MPIGRATFIDKHRGYNAYVIESGRRRVLYGGDTAYQDEFRGIGTDGGVDLAILGIGADDPFIRGGTPTRNRSGRWPITPGAANPADAPLDVSLEPRADE